MCCCRFLHNISQNDFLRSNDGSQPTLQSPGLVVPTIHKPVRAQYESTMGHSGNANLPVFIGRNSSWILPCIRSYANWRRKATTRSPNCFWEYPGGWEGKATVGKRASPTYISKGFKEKKVLQQEHGVKHLQSSLFVHFYGDEVKQDAPSSCQTSLRRKQWN